MNIIQAELWEVGFALQFAWLRGATCMYILNWDWRVEVQHVYILILTFWQQRKMTTYF